MLHVRSLGAAAATMSRSLSTVCASGLRHVRASVLPSSSTTTPTTTCGRTSLLRASPVAVSSPASVRRYTEWSTSLHQVRMWTSDETLAQWILDNVRLMQPARVHLCDGSEEENKELIDKMVFSGQIIPLNPAKRPGCYMARSVASDVARVEEKTFICSETPSDAGFTNNWRDPEETSRMLTKLFDGCMRGRTLYVVPFCMGPVDSPFAQIGVQITDSPYVVASMRIMTRVGTNVLRKLEEKNALFVPCLHSVGAPLKRGEEDSPWPSNPAHKYIVHFPQMQKIISYGSGYGGNALLGKKCFALRIASCIAREEGWLAEHMLIVGITNPQGVKRYIAAAFPSACGKTNLAMLTPSLPGWKIETVGDDIAWIRVGADGRLWAINPEYGFFGVAPGTSMKSNPNAMLTIQKNAIFTNCAITKDGDVWWEGMTDEFPPHLQSWLRREVFADSGIEAAHPNARFTVPASQCPIIDPQWENPKGVPISAIIFGGRRSSTVPLVYQSRDWTNGVFTGASMCSETTAAATGKRGILRADPFAMRPFCGYNMADYFAHWLSFQNRTDPEKLPKIFHVNWFRKSAKGKFLWPGFGENIRVLDWILKRCDEAPKESSIAMDSPIGFLPTPNSVNLTGLKDMNADVLDELSRIDCSEWLADLVKTREFLANFGDKLPKELTQQMDSLQQKLEKCARLTTASTEGVGNHNSN